jgi:transposase
VAEAFGVHPHQFQDWKKRQVQGAEDVFTLHAVGAQHIETEMKKLHSKIGQLTIENDCLAKFPGHDRQASIDKR